MLSVSRAYKRQIIKGNRDYLIKINMTLSDDTELTLTNDDIWEGGLKIDEAISGTDSFDIGSAIIGKCSVQINNIYDGFSQYDFFNATFTLYFGLSGDKSNGEQVYYKKGVYTVESADYNGSIITLDCLDNMWKLDRPYSEVTGLSSTETIKSFLTKLCNYCDITIATQTYHNSNMSVSTSIDGEINCREVLQYLLQLTCSYCYIDANGQLHIGWYPDLPNKNGTDGGTYDTDTTPYSDGDDVDGGNFLDYSSGDTVNGGTFDDNESIAFLSYNSTISVSTDKIVVTGFRVYSSDSGSETSYDVLYGEEGYILSYCDNPFINKTNAQSIANDIGAILDGFEILPFQASSLSNLAYQCSDVCALIDHRGNRFYSYITNLSFNTGNFETFSCGAEPVVRNNTVRYSETIKTLVEARKNAQEVVSNYNKAVQEMNDLAQQAIGYNEYTTLVSGKTVMFRYNGNSIDATIPDKPKFSDSTVVFKISGDGVFVSTSKDAQGYEEYTNGYDANSGTAILNLLYVQGLNADWINAGTINAIDINGSTITGGSISGTYISSTASDGGHVDINGGSLKVFDSSNAYLKVQDKNNSSKYLTLGSNHISSTDGSSYVEFDTHKAMSTLNSSCNNGLNGWKLMGEDNRVYIYVQFVNGVAVDYKTQ